jgi:hypothetical protein
MTDLIGLAERCEQALETHQVMLLWEAWEAINGKAEPIAIDRWPGWRMPEAWERFKSMVNAHAYLDAAMTLVNGMGGEVTFFKDGTAKAFLWQPYPMAIEAKAATAALALCAAALRTHATKETHDGTE